MGGRRRGKKINVDKIADSFLLVILCLSIFVMPSRSHIFFYWVAAVLIAFVGARRARTDHLQGGALEMLADLPTFVPMVLCVVGVISLCIIVLALSFPPLEMEHVVRAYVAGAGVFAIILSFFPAFKRCFGSATTGSCFVFSGVIIIFVSLSGTLGHTQDLIGASIAITTLELLSIDSLSALLLVQCLSCAYVWVYRAGLGLERENPFGILDIIVPALLLAHASRFTEHEGNVRGNRIGRLEENIWFTYACSTGVLLILKYMNIFAECPLLVVASPLCTCSYFMTALCRGELGKIMSFRPPYSVGVKER